MVLFTALIVISSVLAHTGTAEQPVVTFSPDWKKIFIGESITMTCDVGSTKEREVTYLWYKDGTQIHTGKSFTIRSARTGHSGDYSCRAGAGRSPIARLDVDDGDVILQAPLYVHEGDDLTLRCHHRGGYTGTYTIFYKENSVIQRWRETSEFHVRNLEMKDSGRYGCEKPTYKQMKITHYYRAEVSISIQELFENPEVIWTSHPLIEGDHMTLTCDTRLSPLRQRTELQFAFYRDGRKVQEFSSSDQYGVQSAQLEDSGKYSCDVRASVGLIKRSPVVIIQIDLFDTPKLNVSPLQVMEGDNMTLSCDTRLSPLRQRTELQFAFYRDGQKVQEFSSSDEYGVQSAQLEDSGNYSCDVRSTDIISKKSEEVYVHIRERDRGYKVPLVIVTLLVLLLVAVLLMLKFQHNLLCPITRRRRHQPDQQLSSRDVAGESASHTDVFYSELHRVPQGSATLTSGPDVNYAAVKCGKPSK